MGQWGGQCLISLEAKYIMTTWENRFSEETKYLSQHNSVFSLSVCEVLPGEGLFSEHFNYDLFKFALRVI